MNVAKRRGKQVHSRIHKLLRLLSTRHESSQVKRIRNAVFSALNPPRLCLCCFTVRMAVSNQLLCLGEVFLLGVMRHVYHDGVERQQTRRLDHFFILAVVEMHCHGDRGLAGGLGGGVDEDAVGGGDGPGEELDDERRFAPLCCFDEA